MKTRISKELMPDSPQHVAIIMDGNGRWARSRGMPRVAGHRASVKVVRKIVEECGERGVSYLTLFAFSSENWSRPADEVGASSAIGNHWARSSRTGCGMRKH